MNVCVHVISLKTKGDAIPCLCHFLHKHVECFPILHYLLDNCVWWYSLFHIHDGHVWCCNISVSPADNHICCYTLYVPPPCSPQMTIHYVSIICLLGCIIVQCYTMSFHLLENHTSCYTMAALSLWYPHTVHTVSTSTFRLPCTILHYIWIILSMVMCHATLCLSPWF